MRLGNRLNCIATYVPQNAKLADVGTDHAYLPIYLVENEQIDFAIATDIVQGPCEAAKKSVEKYTLQNKISVRQGDGLSSVNKGEIDTVVVAGMGGSSIVDILAKGSEVLLAVTTLVLQPMTEGFLLRKWLCENNWLITNEDLVVEGERLYEIIVTKKGVAKQLNNIELLVGPILLKKGHVLLKKHFQNIIDRYDFICRSMENSPSAVASAKYKEYKCLLNELKERLQCL